MDFQKKIIGDIENEDNGDIEFRYESHSDVENFTYQSLIFRINYRKNGSLVTISNIRIIQEDLIPITDGGIMYLTRIWSTEEILCYNKLRNTMDRNPMMYGNGDGEDPPPRELSELLHDMFRNCPNMIGAKGNSGSSI